MEVPQAAPERKTTGQVVGGDTDTIFVFIKDHEAGERIVQKWSSFPTLPLLMEQLRLCFPNVLFVKIFHEDVVTRVRTVVSETRSLEHMREVGLFKDNLIEISFIRVNPAVSHAMSPSTRRAQNVAIEQLFNALY
jgi:hypothetical protein